MRKYSKLFIGMFIVLCIVFVKAQGDVSVSKNSITLNKGDSTSFTITPVNSAGVIEISSSDTSVVTVDESKIFVDSQDDDGDPTKVINIRAVGSGTATINIVLSDVATYDLEELTGSRIIEVVVNDDTAGTEGHDDDQIDDQAHDEEIIENVPKTAANIKSIVLFTGILIMLSGVGIIYYVNKKRSINE